MAAWRCSQEAGKHAEFEPREMSFTKDGKLMAARHSPTQIHLIDPATGRSLAELSLPEQRSLVWLCVSPDGSRLAAASRPFRLHVWDLRLSGGS